MLCYLRLHLELEMRAKGVLLMRENGLEPDARPGSARQVRRAALSRAQHRSHGRRAMQPFLHLNARDLWQIHMLDR